MIRAMRVAILVVALVATRVAGQQTAAEVVSPAKPLLDKISDPLVRVLVIKGLISENEATEIAAGDSNQQRTTLALVLRKKGILTDAELENVIGPVLAKQTAAEIPLGELTGADAVEHRNRVVAAGAPEAAPAALAIPIAKPVPAVVVKPTPPVIAAYAPIRVLPVDRIQKDSIIPDIKLGSGARLKVYGLVKASAIYDSSSPSGTDMPLPYLNNDTGPTVDPEFHVRARNTRLGAQFEWPDFSPKMTLTGRFETDFEGNFTRSLNRNISTVRSSTLSLRVAWGRVDRTVNDKLTFFALVGQDWTPFGSSTLPNLLETTGLGLGYGTLYERLPQVRVGFTRTVGGSRNLKFQPEFAVTMPAFGNTPLNISDQLGYGERQGADSGRPEIQGRFVTQWQFDGLWRCRRRSLS